MERSAELEALLMGFMEAHAKRDSAFIEKTISTREGLLFIGTDPNEWWAGYETVARAIPAEGEAAGITVVPGDPVAYAEGTVGWAADQSRFQLPDGTEVPCRVTWVFHKENGEWKIVQLHVSIGVPNEDVFG